MSSIRFTTERVSGPQDWCYCNLHISGGRGGNRAVLVNSMTTDVADAFEAMVASHDGVCDGLEMTLAAVDLMLELPSVKAAMVARNCVPGRKLFEARKWLALARPDTSAEGES